MQTERPERYTRAIVDLGVLSENFRRSRNYIGADLAYMAVVKANAYGHGAVECARRLEADGVDWFGVAIPDEGRELRLAGIRKPILILGSFCNGEEQLLIDHDLTPVIFDVDRAASLSRALGPRRNAVHVKIDTGMGRLGIRYDRTAELARQLQKFQNLDVTGIMTHFASADDPGQDDFTNTQLDRFDLALKEFHAAGFDPKVIDVANSPGGIRHERARAGMIRLGGALYGLLADILPTKQQGPDIRPVLSLVSRVASIKSMPAGEGIGYGRTHITSRESNIALVPIGYADGYPRPLSNSSSVIIRDQRAPVVGRISMDWTIIDVTDIPRASCGDEVILIGESASHAVKAADVAAQCGTIGYEVTCGIGQRVPRVYVN